jgi:hypothetical protein
METGQWPGYPDITKATTPPWVSMEHEYNLEQWGMAS